MNHCSCHYIFLYIAVYFLCHYRREGWPLHVLQTCCFACMPRRQSDLGCLKPRWDVVHMNSQLLRLRFRFYVFSWTIKNVFFIFSGWGFSAVPWGTTNTSGSVVGSTFDVWIKSTRYWPLYNNIYGFIYSDTQVHCCFKLCGG